MLFSTTLSRLSSNATCRSLWPCTQVNLGYCGTMTMQKGWGVVFSITLQDLTPHSPLFPKPLGMQRPEASSAPSPGSMQVHSGSCQMGLVKGGLHGLSPRLGVCILGKAESFPAGWPARSRSSPQQGLCQHSTDAMPLNDMCSTTK